VEPLDGPSEEIECRFVGPYEFVESRIGDGRVGSHTAGSLKVACARDPQTHGLARGTLAWCAENCPGNLTDRHTEVDTIEERSREFSPIARECRIITAAIAPRCSIEAAGTGVRRSDKLKSGRKFAPVVRTRDADDTLLDHLAKRFQAATIELGKFVEEEYTVMRE
jgi:hypothetical protein